MAVLSTSGDVHAAVEGANQAENHGPNKLAEMRRVSAAGYLIMLAEEVKKGAIKSFDLSWDECSMLRTECCFHSPTEFLVGSDKPKR